MNVMTQLSLLVNLLVLIPVCIGLLRNASWTARCYGSDSPARSILLSVYLTLALASAWMLAVPDQGGIVLLLSMQIVYKLGTPVFVRTIRNPVVLSNLAIAALHAVTLYIVVT